MTGRRPAPRRRAGTEAAFTDDVLGLARFYQFTGYHTHDSRRSQAGFPDLVLIRPPRLIFAELKLDKPTATRARAHDVAARPDWLRRRDLTAAQADWLTQLADIPGVEAYVWTPSHLQDIAGILAGADMDPEAGRAWAGTRSTREEAW